VWDLHIGERPIDQPNTKWVSSEPSIWFEVPEDNGREGFGEIDLNGEMIEFIVFLIIQQECGQYIQKSGNLNIRRYL
jgi:hypothetical protein